MVNADYYRYDLHGESHLVSRKARKTPFCTILLDNYDACRSGDHRFEHFPGMGGSFDASVSDVVGIGGAVLFVDWGGNAIAHLFPDWDNPLASYINFAFSGGLAVFNDGDCDGTERSVAG